MSLEKEQMNEKQIRVRIKRMALSYERVSQNKLPSQIYYNSRENKKAASSLRFSKELKVLYKVCTFSFKMLRVGLELNTVL